MDIVKLKIKDLTPYEKNAKKHPKEQVNQIVESIKKYGMNDPIGIWGSKNIIVEGHGRVLALKKMGIEEVDCIRLDHLTDAERKEYTLIHNKTTMNSDFELDILNEELKDILDLDQTFDAEFFDFDLSGLDKELGEVVEDEVPDVEETEPVAKKGQLYKLGNHRLMCGDSTSKDDIEKLTGGELVDLLFTDPPYGMKKENEGVLNDNLNFNDLLDFNKKWIPLTFEKLKDNGSWYCWGIDEPLMDIYAFILKPMIKDNKITFRNLITWDKGNGRGQMCEDFRMYPIADEKCLFVMCGVQGFNNNADHYFEGWEPIRDYLLNSRLSMGWDVPTMKKIVGHSGISRDHWTCKSQWTMPTREVYEKMQEEAEKQRKEKGLNNDAFKREYDDLKREYYSTRAYFDNTHDNQNNVWHFDRTSTKERELTGEHATPKPIALCSRAIKSSSRENDKVLDLFGGSGSTLIACEQLNRNCYMMELDPHYVDVIIKRWETLTGKKAELISE